MTSKIKDGKGLLQIRMPENHINEFRTIANDKKVKMSTLARYLLKKYLLEDNVEGYDLLAVEIPVEYFKKFKKLAKEKNLTMNKFICFLLDKYLEEKDKN